MAQWIRMARLHAPKGMPDPWYDGYDAGLRQLMVQIFVEGSLELKSFDVLLPSKVAMNRKPRFRK